MAGLARLAVESGREVEAGNEWIVDAETAVQAMGGGCVDMAGGDRRSASSVATTADASSPKGHRWAIEDSFETAKNELGLDHNETRSWHGWHRNVSLVMLAFAMMAVIHRHANKTPPPKTKVRAKASSGQA